MEAYYLAALTEIKGWGGVRVVMPGRRTGMDGRSGGSRRGSAGLGDGATAIGSRARLEGRGEAGGSGVQ